MNAAVFALTGLGNIVVEELINQNVKILFLSTREEKDRYPYFDCPNIIELCKKYNIATSEDKDFFSDDCNILITATYHKKIILSNCKFKLGVNIHPSYLPHLKGRDPIREALNKNEQNLGITTHKLTNKFDTGEILFQNRINFDKNDSKKSVIKSLIPLYKHHTQLIVKYYKKNYSEVL